MNSPKQLLLANRAWASEKLSLKADYFEKLAADQNPDYLWIGCSDSRVPAEEVTGARPGEIFVHRNVANIVMHNDFNVMSVIQYAVEVLKVKHIIVCGHYGCGGVRAAASNDSFGLINHWIHSIKGVLSRNEATLSPALSQEERLDRLVEFNVREQVLSIGKTLVVQKAWQAKQPLAIHGWVFDIKTGLLTETNELNSVEDLPDVYRYRLANAGERW